MDRARATKAWHALAQWFDAGAAPQVTDGASRDRVDWARIVPFVGMHLACLGVIWVGISPVAVGAAVALYVLRMFAITGFYHRYFSHRTFKTSRAAQFAFAVLGASAVQRGPIWWAAHHRHHHAHSDQPDDVHSPAQHGFLWSHMGWFLSRGHFAPDLGAFATCSGSLSCAGSTASTSSCRRRSPWRCSHWAGFSSSCWPALGTSGGQMLVWGFFVSTVACYHGTYTINSLSHVLGRRRYDTGDDEPQQLAAGHGHARRGLAQQSPPLSDVGARRGSTGGRSTLPITCCGRWPRSASSGT